MTSDVNKVAKTRHSKDKSTEGLTTVSAVVFLKLK